MVLIISEEQYFINEFLEKEKANFSIENIKIISEDSDIEKIILDLSSSSLFNNPKLFIFDNISVFFEKNIKNNIYLKVLEVIKNNSTNRYIFICKSEITGKNEFVNFVSSNAKIIEIPKLKANLYPKLIKDTVEKNGGSISITDAGYLAQKLNNNLEIIMLETKKLILENKNIEKEIIDISVGFYEKDSGFMFVNSIMYNDFILIYNSYLDRKRSGDSIQLLIAQLAQQLILSNRVYSLKKEGLNSKEISLKLSIHLFRVVNASKLVSILTISKIKRVINSLSNIDYDIKVKGVDDEKAFELFLIKEFAK